MKRNNNTHIRHNYRRFIESTENLGFEFEWFDDGGAILHSPRGDYQIRTTFAGSDTAVFFVTDGQKVKIHGNQEAASFIKEVDKIKYSAFKKVMETMRAYM